MAEIESNPVIDERQCLVVGIDGSEDATRALDWAAGQAALTGAILEIHTVHVTQYQFATLLDIELAMTRLTDQAVARVQRAAPGIATKMVAHVGSPAKALVDASKGADLLVVGSRGLGGFGGLILGSVGHSCVLHADCPVVVVRPPRAGLDYRPWWPPSRIVVGVDGSASSAQALEWALSEAELTQAAVTAVTTWTWPNSFAWGLPLPANFDMESDAKTILHQVADPVVAQHPTVDVSLEVANGHPALSLVGLSRSADLLVMGNRGHGQLASALLGSVSEYCVAHAECPVLVVRGPVATRPAPACP